MNPIVSPAQMAEADRLTIARGTPSIELMERAGRSAARYASEITRGSYGKRYLIVCGKGNNGGDGLVAARHLLNAGGLPTVLLIWPANDLSHDAKEKLQNCLGVRVKNYSPELLARELLRTDLVIDAIFGTGFKDHSMGSVSPVIDAINESGLKVLAIDIPSGVNGSTGMASSPSVSASHTVTFGAMKTGIAVTPGASYAGEIRVADIGIDVEAVEPFVGMPEKHDVVKALGSGRTPASHKKSVGTVLIVAGSRGMSGAATLAGLGALRAGAGLVTIAAPRSVADEIDQRLLEATVVPLPETDKGTIESSAVELIQERSEQVDVVAIGPGLTTQSETVEFVQKIVGLIVRPIVLDADALNAIGNSLEILASRQGVGTTILTPHPGEMSRLLAKSTQAVEENRIPCALDAATRAHATVVLKGYRSVIAGNDGRVVINPTGGPVLATGGSGDVLTGAIAALAARITDPFVATWLGVWLHGRAGDLLSSRGPSSGIIASDIADSLGDALNVEGLLAR